MADIPGGIVGCAEELSLAERRIDLGGSRGPEPAAVVDLDQEQSAATSGGHAPSPLSHPSVFGRDRSVAHQQLPTRQVSQNRPRDVARVAADPGARAIGRAAQIRRGGGGGRETENLFGARLGGASSPARSPRPSVPNRPRSREAPAAALRPNVGVALTKSGRVGSILREAEMGNQAKPHPFRWCAGKDGRGCGRPACLMPNGRLCRHHGGWNIARGARQNPRRQNPEPRTTGSDLTNGTRGDRKGDASSRPPSGTPGRASSPRRF